MPQERPSFDQVIAFSQLSKQLEPLAGGKGRTLARLYQAHYRVPDGFVILPTAFVDDELPLGTWKQVQQQLARLRRLNRNGAFAVRSSAIREDSARARMSSRGVLS